MTDNEEERARARDYYEKTTGEILRHYQEEFSELGNPFNDEFIHAALDWYDAKEYHADALALQFRDVATGGRCDDFLNKNWPTTSRCVPSITKLGNVVMALTAAEIQSAVLPEYLAHGVVGVCGLSMGYAVLRFARKPEVTAVDVWEIDADLIEWFKRCFARRDGFDKINLIHADATEKMFDLDYDFVYNDMRHSPDSPDVLEDIALLTSENRITEYWYNGLELVILNALNASIIGAHDLTDLLKMYFIQWSLSPKSINGVHTVKDQDIIYDILNAMAESGASRHVDMIV